jgi:lysophospholipase L1-like esterase
MYMTSLRSSDHSHLKRRGLLIKELFSVMIVTLFGSMAALGQPRMPEIPDATRMILPSPEQSAQLTAALNAFKESLSPELKELLQANPGIVRLHNSPFHTAVNPSLNYSFLAQHLAQVERAKQGNIDVLFMGDSITDWWDSDRAPYNGIKVFEEYFGNWKIANFGIAGDTTQGVLYRLRDGEGEGYKPRVIMLLIGVNNTRTNSAPEIAEGIGAIVTDLQQRFPTGKILLLGIFPYRDADDPVRTEIKFINSKISQLHDGEQVHFLDIGHIFLDEYDNIPTSFMSDKLHPTEEGYKLWAEAIIGPLTNLLNSVD